MKTLITDVTLQYSVANTKVTVFTNYKKGTNTYDGFNVCNNLEEAKELANKQINLWDEQFMSLAKGYTINEFDVCGNLTKTFIKC